MFVPTCFEKLKYETQLGTCLVQILANAIVYTFSLVTDRWKKVDYYYFIILLFFHLSTLEAVFINLTAKPLRLSISQTPIPYSWVEFNKLFYVYFQ